MKGAPDCKSAKCGIDAGCRRESDDSWICICTHDLSPPREDGSCPRNVIVDSTTTFKSNITDQMEIEILSSLERESSLYPTMIVLSSLGFIVSVLIVYLIVIVLRRRGGAGAFLDGGQSLWCLKAAYRLPLDNMVSNQMYSPTEMATSSGRFTESLILLREWIELEYEIGEGFFGKVYRGRLKRIDEQLDLSYINLDEDLVAVKKLKPVSANVVNSLNDELMREASTVASFSHPNILSFKGVVFNECNIAPWIVFEYMELGDLAELLRRTHLDETSPTGTNRRLPSRWFKDGDLVSMAEQIACGMKYLSSKQYVHRDLACRNCLVTERQSRLGHAEFVVKISDFGMSRNLDTSTYYQMQGSRILPVRWMAPEAILYGKFCLESDVWSYGIVLWEIFTLGAIPYCGCSNEQVVDLIRNGNVLEPPENSPEFINQIMIEGCWQKQPRNRLTFAEICEKFKEHLTGHGETVQSDTSKECQMLYLEMLPDPVTVA